MPFTEEQFLNIFSEYNLTVWPIQVFLNILAFFSVILIFKKFSFSDKLINFVLSFLWLWMGIIYHIIFFSPINPAANIFGALFIIQGFLFFYLGVFRGNLTYNLSNSHISVLGFIFILFALFIYPFIGIFFGHIFPNNPTFGLPCPTTIFTFGILLFAERKIPFYMIIIPFIWSLIGFTAAVNLGIYEDTGLLIIGLVSSGLILFSLNKRRFKTV